MYCFLINNSVKELPVNLVVTSVFLERLTSVLAEIFFLRGFIFSYFIYIFSIAGAYTYAAHHNIILHFYKMKHIAFLSAFLPKNERGFFSYIIYALVTDRGGSV